MDAHIALLKELAVLGKELGYRDAELNKWVTAQFKITEDKAKAEQQRAAEEARVAEEKAKRQQQRADEEARAAEEKAKVEQQRADDRARAAEEREERRIAREEERLEREEKIKQEEYKAQMELKRMEIELQQAKVTRRGEMGARDDDHDDTEGEEISGTRPAPKSGPKLPFFDDAKDDIDSYLRRFERYSEMQGWPRTEWALYLSALLKGKSLECYSRLAEADARDYSKLKSALLRRFDLTAEGFRRKFYEARRDKDETAAQFVVRLVGYLDRWIQLAGIECTYEGLMTLLVRERFLDSCDDRLALYLRERSPNDLDEVVSLADHYLDARSNKPVRGKDVDLGKKPYYNKHKTHYGNDSGSENTAKSSNPFTSRRMDKSRVSEDKVCYNCGLPGHIRRDCKQKAAPEVKRHSGHDSAAVCELVNDRNGNCTTNGQHMVEDRGSLPMRCGCELPYAGCLMVGPKAGAREKRLNVVQGRIGNTTVSCLRDTGCTTGVVRSSLVKSSDMTGNRKCFRMLDGTLRQAETAIIHLQSPIFTGDLECLCVASPICDVVVGNVPGVTDAVAGEAAKGDEQMNAVMTRAQTRAHGKALKPLRTPVLQDLHVSVADMERLQSECNDLARSFQLAKSGEPIPSGKSATASFSMDRGLLHRIYKLSGGMETKQLVVPDRLRKGAMGLAHESVMAGHLGVSKTLDRLLTQFWWPGIGADVARFVKSCDACQRTTPKGRVGKAPMQKMPIITEPFCRVGIDLVGPITPPSSSGNRYILCVVDYATRYPEAVALPGISTVQVAEALCKVFSRTGIPKEILSDQGSQFVSDVMREVYRLLSINHMVSSPYHPQTNGLVEKFNGTLKAMVKRLCLERPSDWDRYLEPALFAYREVKQDSLGFSPFELIYGRTVRGPMAILRELWSKDLPDEELQNTYQYVFELRNRMEETCKLVQESLADSQVKAKKHFDRKAKKRKLNVGDKVLILLPTDSHKMLMTWKGPYTVVECIGLTDYRVQLEANTKVFHINMLKQYHERDAVNERVASGSGKSTPAVSNPEPVTEEVAAGVLEEDEDDALELVLPEKRNAEGGGLDEIHVSPDLTSRQSDELWELLQTYADIFSNTPGETDTAEHQIILADSNPVRGKTYPVPYSLREEVKAELSEMVRLGIVEPSNSPYSSPLLMVKKKDGTYRPVVDYRSLNRITVFDSEPMPNAEDIFARLSGARFFSKLDFCKGYWQIPMAEADRAKTAFSTPFGLYQFRRMPFGLQNAGATYGRMMRRVLDGLTSTDNFVDDVITFSSDWKDQLDELKELFGRVRHAGLTVKPSKCYFGYANVEFLGHKVGDGKLEMLEDKVEQVASAPPPNTKKQLRSFLGLSGYYRRFIRDYARVAAPLTDALKGGNSAPLRWGLEQEAAFAELKQHLCAKPILRLPDMDRPFVLRTDASDAGLGAVLLQEHDEGIFPVAYASRKLTKAEQNYAVVERECLAIVWAVAKFHRYLYGGQFVLQTDHRPLTFLDSEDGKRPGNEVGLSITSL